MQLNLTRFRATRYPPFYVLHDEQQLDTSQHADDIEALVRATQTRKFSDQPRAWGFGTWMQDEDAGNSKRTWRSSSAVLADFRSSADEAEREQLVAELWRAARQLNHGFYFIETCDRDFGRTNSIVFPTVTPIVSEARYARIASVLYEQMKALGVTALPCQGFAAMTHLTHVHSASGAVWHDAPLLNVDAKIRATRKAAQDIRLERFSGAAAQLSTPTHTFAVEPGLFEGLTPAGANNPAA